VHAAGPRGNFTAPSPFTIMINDSPASPVAIRFLTANAVLGAVVGSVFAFFVLLTDTFGIFTLIRADANPILPAFAFVIGCMTAFMTMVVATAVALADAEEESSTD
jgi:hypothetical protein